MTNTETRSIPTAAEAKAHPAAKMVRKAANAAKRDGRSYCVIATHTGYRIWTGDESALKFSRYYRVFADRAEVVEG